ncbi:MAG: N-acetylmuramoyl-L-alanine amidase [Candidatus Woesebacteria bacterium]
MNYPRFVLFTATLSLFTACTKVSPPVHDQPLVPSPEASVVPDNTVLPLQSPTPEVTPFVTSIPKSSPKTVAVGTRVSISSLPSSFHSDDERALSTIDTIVIHSLYNPKYPADLSITHAKEVLDESEVSSHFVIARDGKVFQLVSEKYQAWHAGESAMPSPDNRTKINSFSIGIELIGTESSGFTTAQYDSSAKLTADLMDKLPITKITGHSDIAPGRKTDPWNFQWKNFETLLKVQTTKSFTILRVS